VRYDTIEDLIQGLQAIQLAVGNIPVYDAEGCSIDLDLTAYPIVSTKPALLQIKIIRRIKG